MKKLVFLFSVCMVFAVAQGAAAQETVTTSTQVESPDGTVTTVVSPSVPATVPTSVTKEIDVGGGTTMIKDVPVSSVAKDGTLVEAEPVPVDAMTGKPVEAEPEEKSLRDKVRSKME